MAPQEQKEREPSLWHFRAISLASFLLARARTHFASRMGGNERNEPLQEGSTYFSPDKLAEGN